jgi:hypothetical protein
VRLWSFLATDVEAGGPAVQNRRPRHLKIGDAATPQPSAQSYLFGGIASLPQPLWTQYP